MDDMIIEMDFSKIKVVTLVKNKINKQTVSKFLK
jgi:hypothetical protein